MEENARRSSAQLKSPVTNPHQYIAGTGNYTNASRATDKNEIGHGFNMRQLAGGLRVGNMTDVVINYPQTCNCSFSSKLSVSSPARLLPDQEKKTTGKTGKDTAIGADPSSAATESSSTTLNEVESTQLGKKRKLVSSIEPEDDVEAILLEMLKLHRENREANKKYQKQFANLLDTLKSKR